MAITYSETLRQARLTAVSTTIGTSGLLRIYNGTRPASGGAATTLLAELTCAATFGTVTGNVLTANAIASDTTANATGDATWFRLTTSAGTFVVDGDVRETADADTGQELVLDEKSVVANGTVAVSSLTVTGGNL